MVAPPTTRLPMPAPRPDRERPAHSAVRVPANPDPFERIQIDGEPWVWVPETARWVLEATLPRRRDRRLTGSGLVR
jgi:hypothetical protein